MSDEEIDEYLESCDREWVQSLSPETLFLNLNKEAHPLLIIENKRNNNYNILEGLWDIEFLLSISNFLFLLFYKELSFYNLHTSFSNDKF